MQRRVLLSCLVLSGASGLGYELLWTRLLSLGFGSTLLSFSTVIAVFFGGLAIGADVAGRRASRLARPIRAYALIELATGVLGLALYPLLTGLDELFAVLDPGSGLGAAAVRLAFAVPLLLLPTLLMGATLPVVSRAMILHDGDVGRGTAVIYGLNTAGALLGVYLITYHALPAFGVFTSLLLTVLTSFAAAGLALAADGTSPAAPVPVPEATADLGPLAQPVTPPKVVMVTTALAFLGGFSAIAFQIVWVRIFSIFLEGTIYGVSAVLICVLGGITAGSLSMSGLLRERAREARVAVATRPRRIALWFAGLQLVSIGAVLLLSRELLFAGWLLRSLGAPLGGGPSSLHAQLLGTMALLLVPTFCSGASFPALVELTGERAAGAARVIGRLYAANTLGSILGSLLTGFVLLPSSGSEATVLIALAILALTAAAAGSLLTSGQGERTLGLGAAALALGGVALYSGLDIKAVSTAGAPRGSFADYRDAVSKRLEQLVYFAEGEGATVAVFAAERSRSLTLNGLGQGGRSAPPPHHVLESLLVALVPLVHAEPPARTLLVGLGAGVTVDLLRRLDLPRIEVVELEPRVIDAVRVIFSEDCPLDDPAVTITAGDARHQLLLARGRGGAGHDLITSMPAHPWVAPAIFTQEFFELARDNLSERGVFSTWFGIPDASRSPQRQEGSGAAGPPVNAITRSLFAAFAAVFPSYVIYWVPEVGAYYLVGSKGRLSFDLARATALAAHPDVSEHPALRDPYFLPARVFASSIAAEPAAQPGGPVNTDDSAYVELHAPRTATEAVSLDGVLPDRLLLPALVDPPARREVFAELLERLLGTPRGELPFGAGETPIDLPTAERTLRAAEELWPSAVSDYFRARVALVNGRRGEARAALRAAATSAPEPFAGRARKFVALTYSRETAEHRDTLASLPVAPDVLLAQLDADPERARGRLAALAMPADRTAEPLTWLLARAGELLAQPGTSRSEPQVRALTPDERVFFSEHVGRELSSTRNLGLLALSAELAEREGLHAQARACEEWRRTRARARAAELARRGYRRMNAGDLPKSAELFELAAALDPGNPRLLELLIRARAGIRDSEGLDRAVRQLRFLGRSERWIAWLLEQVEAGKLTGGPEDFAPLNPLSGRPGDGPPLDVLSPRRIEEDRPGEGQEQ